MINFDVKEVLFTIPFPTQQLDHWINQIVIHEHSGIGDINFVFLSDEELLDINLKYLNHDYYTDIITFNSNTPFKIAGDIFISVDMMATNAKKFNISVNNEFLRLLAHGILHLLGYNDHTKDEKVTMREKEDFYIQFYSSLYPE